MQDRIFGYSWDAIQGAQKRGKLHETIKQHTGDYGHDPIGNGMVRMIPSGDIVTIEEATARLKKARA